MSKVLHIVPGTGDVANGMVVVACLLAKEQGDAAVVDLNHEIHKIHEKDVEEVWVHGMWLPKEWSACRMVLRDAKRLVRMTHGSLSPVYLTRQSSLKKKLVAPIERYFLRRADKLVATCQAEAEWIEAYLGRRCPPIEVTDLKRFFKLGNGEPPFAKATAGERGTTLRQGYGWRAGNGKNGALHILYLGRRHPLKGVEYLESAVAQLTRSPFPRLRQGFGGQAIPRSPQLKVVSNAFGEEKAKIWDWCDVLVLPTLSENFGLVVAEALERGKRVITTDGAPAWNHEIHETHEKGVWSGYGGRLIYLKGYRDGTPEHRIMLLKRAIESLLTPTKISPTALQLQL